MERTKSSGWIFEVDQILTRCETGAVDQAQLLRDVHVLISTQRAPICRAIKPEITASALEMLLERGAYESAALRMLSRCGLMFSRDQDGLSIATVVPPSSDRDYSFSAFSECVALVGALMTCLQETVTAE